MLFINQQENINQLLSNPKSCKLGDHLEYTECVQSANVIFKYMNKLEYLKEIIQYQAIFPRYYEESIEYLELDEIKKIAFPMVCFCDINFSKIESHVNYYGKFGIGFSKAWAQQKGIQPIHYLSENSALKQDLSSALNKSIKTDINLLTDGALINDLKSYILHQLLYTKPVNGKMLRDENYDNRNFTDECEWRFIPKIEQHHGISLLIFNHHITHSGSYQLHSTAIKRIDELWLKFSIEDIKYLMVETEDDRDELINFIRSLSNINQQEADRLLTKITVYNVMKGDW